MRSILFVMIAIFAAGYCVQGASSQPPAGGAGPDTPPGPGGPSGMNAPPGGFRIPSPPLLEAIDSNRDGDVSGDEIAKASSQLKTLDKNQDGDLTQDEVMPSFPGFSQGRRGGPGGGAGGPGGGPRGGPGGPGGPGGGEMKLLSQFDEDKDGMLNQQERSKARAYLKENRGAGGGMFGRGPGGPGGGSQGSEAKPGRRLSPDEVAKYPDADLYDPHVLRTLFFQFDNKDWEQELLDFHNTDVEVPTQMVVDSKTYKNVGMRFRGGSSYGVPLGKKRSFNVSVDLVDEKQRLLGYRTLNLLNSHTDPSFLRTVLFDHIAGHYVPTPQANLVRVAINGECWGLYVNEEQFNKDFCQRWFGEDDGPRWKIPPNFSGAAALVYHGDDQESYRNLYEIKGKGEKKAWRSLIALCRQLEKIPDDRLETELDQSMDLDRALWFLAVDNVLMDDDGYFSRGSDYCLYQDSAYKRFHLLPRDSNETFRYRGGGPGGPGGPGFGGPGGRDGRDRRDGPGARGQSRSGERGELGRGTEPGGAKPDGEPGFGFGGGPKPDGGPGFGFGGGPGGMGGGRGGSGASLDPLSMTDSNVRPVVRRLLTNQNLRARYLAHVRTIVEEWLDWKKLEPIFEDYRGLVAEEVMADTRNLSSFAEFLDADIAESAGGGPFGAPPGIKRFVDERRKYLLAHPDLTKPRPAILSVKVAGTPQVGSVVEVVAEVGTAVPVASVLLYHAGGRNAPFRMTEMKTSSAGADKNSTSRRYTASIPAGKAGVDFHYYVEARAEKSIGTTTFSPSRSAMGALTLKIGGRTDSSRTARTIPARFVAESRQPDPPRKAEPEFDGPPKPGERDQPGTKPEPRFDDRREPGERGKPERGEGFGPGGRPGGFRPPMFALQEALDGNGDGKLSRDEIEAAPEALKKLDKNGDGKLSAEEIGWPPRFPGFPGGGPGRPGGGSPFGDRGGLSLAERIMKRDADGDGLVTSKELPRSMSFLLRLADTDKNGVIDKKEAEALPPR